ncbi:C40 family peptidase [Arthrobacter rhombi]|uniref:C40 family peptidase n=1 Tax=Arthrobacter rhombi TaxID=71253 RepID=UPI0031DF2662
MTKRHLGRHRAAPVRSNPLGSISKAVSSNAGSVGRQAAVIAAASGLVLTLGVPAEGAPSAREAGKAPAADILRTSVDSPAAVTVADAKPQELKQIKVSVADVKSTDGSAHRAAMRKAAAEREAAQDAAEHQAAADRIDAQTEAAASAEREEAAAGAAMTRQSRQSSTPAPSSTNDNASSTGTVTTASTPAPETTETSPTSSAGLSGIAGMAMSYEGTPYVWGGSSPSGWDCSGFIQYIYGKAGISLPHNTTAIRTSGKFVKTSNPKPGDLVYQNGGSHAGIYIGGGKIIGAQNPSVGTVVRPADSPYGPLMGYYTYVG